MAKEGSQLKKELVQSRNEYKKVSISLKKEVAQHIKSKEHIRNLKSELQMEKDRVETKKELVKMNEAKFKANAEAAKSRHVMELQKKEYDIKLKDEKIQLKDKKIVQLNLTANSNKDKIIFFANILVKQMDRENQINLMNSKADVR